MRVDKYDFRDLANRFEDEYEKALSSLGTFNVAVFGDTGAGKSTLINAVFGKQLAATDIGDSITRHITYHGGPPEPLGIYDNRGFGLDDSSDVDSIVGELRRIVADNRSKPLSERIHVVWFVSNFYSRRFLDGHARFVRALADLQLPVMMVLTQVPLTREGKYHKDALALAEYIRGLELPTTPRGKVFMVNSIGDADLGQPAHGLKQLLEATFPIVPAAVHEALIASQRVDVDLKRKKARQIVIASAAAAGGTGAVPVPLVSDAGVLAVIMTMIARVSAAYGVNLGKRRTMRVAAVAFSGGATIASGRIVAKLVGELVAKTAGKSVPGVNIAVAAISGGTAAILTTASGLAWMKVCERLLADPALKEEDASRIFVEEFRTRAKEATA
ncbi:GTPase [Actinorhabdospora filicis]|uniref:GTPase n=1 Tax=Actinorhabdospora filicis TaxID=1785913 RepID=A0A9W6SK06_9ACTN|nr:DUF697 domain-containing protein [Actinorhabdospora filicis]GLZ77398.1 GTPase [Actinorhabdospora filicis]